MNLTPSQCIVLANFLGDATPLPYNLHAYAKDFPGNCIITFEEDKSGRVYRIFFAIYGKSGEFTAELSGMHPQWPEGNCRASLRIVRPSEVNRCRGHETHVIDAFDSLAREEFAKRAGREVQPEEWGDLHDL